MARGQEPKLPSKPNEGGHAPAQTASPRVSATRQGPGAPKQDHYKGTTPSPRGGSGNGPRKGNSLPR